MMIHCFFLSLKEEVELSLGLSSLHLYYSQYMYQIKRNEYI
jgi:hypothetical protein